MRIEINTRCFKMSAYWKKDESKLKMKHSKGSCSSKHTEKGCSERERERERGREREIDCVCMHHGQSPTDFPGHSSKHLVLLVHREKVKNEKLS
jgi:hypothetical protein